MEKIDGPRTVDLNVTDNFVLTADSRNRAADNVMPRGHDAVDKSWSKYFTLFYYLFGFCRLTRWQPITLRQFHNQLKHLEVSLI